MTPEQFKTIRHALGLSINQMADALGVHGRIVRYYESGERNVSGTVQKLLDYITRYGILKKQSKINITVEFDDLFPGDIIEKYSPKSDKIEEIEILRKDEYFVFYKDKDNFFQAHKNLWNDFMFQINFLRKK